jgi:hypothetical protein
MCRTRMLLAIVCLSLSLVCAPGSVPGAQAAPASPDTTIFTPNWLFESNQPYDAALDHRQLVVASGCDVNGDGYEDVLVGKGDYNDGATDSGGAWLYYGGPSGLGATPSRTFDPPVANTYGFFGGHVACDLDVNHDHYDDILISMSNYDAGYADEGAVFLWYGRPTVPDAGHNWMAHGDATYAHFGLSLDSAGDVNGDSYDDVIVGARRDDNNVISHAYVWYGGSGGLGDTGTPSNADWSAAAPVPGSSTGGISFGSLVRGIGDVNGDGHDDVMVGAPQYSTGISNQGAVYVWYGSSSGPNNGVAGTLANANWRAYGGQQDSYFGTAGDGVGDLNGDGKDDLAVGAYAYDNPLIQEGAVFVWYGSASGLGVADGSPANAGWQAASGVQGAQLGYTLRPAGDVNGDGYADLLAGAYAYPAPNGGGTLAVAGAWFLWLGSSSGLGVPGTAANADVAGYGDQADGRLGRDDLAAGDVNGDGFSDIFAAAYRYTKGQTGEGVVFGYYSTFRRLFLPLVLRNNP